jgi:uncharacterized repeat protein (TIGR01451 family)
VIKGSDILYTISIANNGSADATNVAIVDTLPPGSAFISASAGGVFNPLGNTVSWNLGTVAALGGSGSVTLSVRVGE